MGEGTKWARFRTFGASCWDNIIGDASRGFLTQSSERTAELVLESSLHNVEIHFVNHNPMRERG